MPTTPRSRQVLEAAVLRLLRPLARLLLRHSVPFGAFEELAKRAYVQAALEDFAVPGRKPTASRASILTGLTRKDVQRLLAEAEAPRSEGIEHINRAARVLTGWIRDPAFLDAAGNPKPLAADTADGFAQLVRRHSGDMPVRAVLDELLRLGAVRQRDDGCIEPAGRGYVPRGASPDKLAMLGTDVADLVDTIDHNLAHGERDPRFQRKVMYRALPASAVPAFRELSAAQAQQLLERLDHWLAKHDTDPLPGQTATTRVGLGIYYFEQGGEAAATKD